MNFLYIKKIFIDNIITNCYFIKNINNNKTIIIDPANNVKCICNYLKNYINGKPVAILLTHGHYDHIMAANELRKKFNIFIYAPKNEQKILTNSIFNLSSFFYNKKYIVNADIYLNNNDIFSIADFKIKMYLTPGHTNGSCCYYIINKNIIISGDTIFYEHYGRYDLFTGNFMKIKKSINMILNNFKDSTIIYPGHGIKTNIYHEKLYNRIFNKEK